MRLEKYHYQSACPSASLRPHRVITHPRVNIFWRALNGTENVISSRSCNAKKPLLFVNNDSSYSEYEAHYSSTVEDRYRTTGAPHSTCGRIKCRRECTTPRRSPVSSCNTVRKSRSRFTTYHLRMCFSRRRCSLSKRERLAAIVKETLPSPLPQPRLWTLQLVFFHFFFFHFIFFFSPSSKIPMRGCLYVSIEPPRRAGVRRIKGFRHDRRADRIPQMRLRLVKDSRTAARTTLSLWVDLHCRRCVHVGGSCVDLLDRKENHLPNLHYWESLFVRA